MAPTGVQISLKFLQTCLSDDCYIESPTRGPEAGLYYIGDIRATLYLKIHDDPHSYAPGVVQLVSEDGAEFFFTRAQFPTLNANHHFAKITGPIKDLKAAIKSSDFSKLEFKLLTEDPYYDATPSQRLLHSDEILKAYYNGQENQEDSLSVFKRLIPTLEIDKELLDKNGKSKDKKQLYLTFGIVTGLEQVTVKASSTQNTFVTFLAPPLNENMDMNDVNANFENLQEYRFQVPMRDKTPLVGWMTAIVYSYPDMDEVLKMRQKEEQDKKLANHQKQQQNGISSSPPSTIPNNPMQYSNLTQIRYETAMRQPRYIQCPAFVPLFSLEEPSRGPGARINIARHVSPPESSREDSSVAYRIDNEKVKQQSLEMQNLLTHIFILHFARTKQYLEDHIPLELNELDQILNLTVTKAAQERVERLLAQQQKPTPILTDEQKQFDAAIVPMASSNSEIAPLGEEEDDDGLLGLLDDEDDDCTVDYVAIPHQASANFASSAGTNFASSAGVANFASSAGVNYSAYPSGGGSSSSYRPNNFASSAGPGSGYAPAAHPLPLHNDDDDDDDGPAGLVDDDDDGDGAELIASFEDADDDDDFVVAPLDDDDNDNGDFNIHDDIQDENRYLPLPIDDDGENDDNDQGIALPIDDIIPITSPAMNGRVTHRIAQPPPEKRSKTQHPNLFSSPSPDFSSSAHQEPRSWNNFAASAYGEDLGYNNIGVTREVLLPAIDGENLQPLIDDDTPAPQNSRHKPSYPASNYRNNTEFASSIQSPWNAASSIGADGVVTLGEVDYSTRPHLTARRKMRVERGWDSQQPAYTPQTKRMKMDLQRVIALDHLCPAGLVKTSPRQHGPLPGRNPQYNVPPKDQWPHKNNAYRKWRWGVEFDEIAPVETRKYDYTFNVDERLHETSRQTQQRLFDLEELYLQRQRDVFAMPYIPPPPYSQRQQEQQQQQQHARLSSFTKFQTPEQKVQLLLQSSPEATHVVDLCRWLKNLALCEIKAGKSEKKAKKQIAKDFPGAHTKTHLISQIVQNYSSIFLLYDADFKPVYLNIYPQDLPQIDQHGIVLWKKGEYYPMLKKGLKVERDKLEARLKLDLEALSTVCHAVGVSISDVLEEIKKTYGLTLPTSPDFSAYASPLDDTPLHSQKLSPSDVLQLVDSNADVGVYILNVVKFLNSSEDIPLSYGLCATDIYAKLEHIVHDPHDTFEISLFNITTKQIETQQVDATQANGWLEHGIVKGSAGKYYPLSHYDLNIEFQKLAVLNPKLSHLFGQTQNDVPRNKLQQSLIQLLDPRIRPFYQAIVDNKLYYNKAYGTFNDNTGLLNRNISNLNINSNINTNTNPKNINEPLLDNTTITLNCWKTKYIASGTKSHVFKIYDTNKQQYYAVKITNIETQQEKVELEVCEALRQKGEHLHCCLIKQYGLYFDEIEKQAFLLMEYVEHEAQHMTTLRQSEFAANNNTENIDTSHLQQASAYLQRFSVNDIEHVTYQLSHAAAALASYGFAHGNITPSNFMLLTSNNSSQHTTIPTPPCIKLFDYGSAKKITSPVPPASSLPSSPLSKTTKNCPPPLKISIHIRSKSYYADPTDLYDIGLTSLHLYLTYPPSSNISSQLEKSKRFTRIVSKTTTLQQSTQQKQDQTQPLSYSQESSCTTSYNINDHNINITMRCDFIDALNILLDSTSTTTTTTTSKNNNNNNNNNRQEFYKTNFFKYSIQPAIANQVYHTARAFAPQHVPYGNTGYTYQVTCYDTCRAYGIEDIAQARNATQVYKYLEKHDLYCIQRHLGHLYNYEFDTFYIIKQRMAFSDATRQRLKQYHEALLPPKEYNLLQNDFLFTFADIEAIFAQLLIAVYGLFMAGITHGNITLLSMILQTKEEHKAQDVDIPIVKLTEFQHATMNGAVHRGPLGALNFCAPELLGAPLKTPLQPTVDLFSIGICILALLFGFSPGHYSSVNPVATRADMQRMRMRNTLDTYLKEYQTWYEQECQKHPKHPPANRLLSSIPSSSSSSSLLSPVSTLRPDLPRQFSSSSGSSVQLSRVGTNTIPPSTPSNMSKYQFISKSAQHLSFTHIPSEKQTDILEALNLILSINPNERYKVFTTRFFCTQVQNVMPKLFKYELQMIARSPAVVVGGFSRENDSFVPSSVLSTTQSNNTNNNNKNESP